MYAAQQWGGGWKAADDDRRVRGKINEISDEIAQEMARDLKE
jgi:hypothetical protein